LRIVTPDEMRALDGRTIAAGTPGPVLMERAGWGLFLALRRHVPDWGARAVLFLCGAGNNGGDGLVAARRLREAGLHPEVVVLAGADGLRGDAPQALAAFLASGGRPIWCPGGEGLDAVASRWRQRRRAVAVDSLLGTGSAGAPRGGIARAVALIGRLAGQDPGALVVAVDAPTGIDAETGDVPGPCVSAHLTVTMAYPKAGFFFYPARSHLGRLAVVDIGIAGPPEGGPGLDVLLAPEARALVPRRRPDVHKGQVGRVVVVGGSPGLTGAAALACAGALGAGAGLVTAAVPAGLNPVFEEKLTEVMTFCLPDSDLGCVAEEAAGTLLESAQRWNAWAVGPGLGRGDGIPGLVARLVSEIASPIVVDADGLWALSRVPWPERTGPPAVLTPHAEEMGRLAGLAARDVRGRPVAMASGWSREKGCCTVLKGAPTLVASPDGRVSFNVTGNPGMATGGAGDVLTGVIAALQGQGLDPFDASRLGVYLHGLAGDLAAREAGVALTAGDLAGRLPAALLALGEASSELEESLVEGGIDATCIG